MMGNVFIYIIFALEAIIGVGSSLYIVVSLFWVLLKKIVRKITKGVPLYD